MRMLFVLMMRLWDEAHVDNSPCNPFPPDLPSSHSTPMPSDVAPPIAQPSLVPVAQITESQLQSQRPQRARRAPARLQDYIPHGPGRLIAPLPHGHESSPDQEQDPSTLPLTQRLRLFFRGWKSLPNRFKVAREYRRKPSYIPIVDRVNKK
ncbi:hypothetical protein SISSUDRAFT_1067165 [Sistotremastrum suecicum HHB10207 ss-3]|uniref:Uncharacterized protein n=1 Tax=Sistotremastrum suecicum HHB10207 ss-3 TaxID=1314776 RepID=A0A165XFU5_9AGAM|nr:hypothetical protein SISSUDRAFT_1067165 [Sistotremastrum suecicum HHB10207 ss-3]